MPSVRYTVRIPLVRYKKREAMREKIEEQLEGVGAQTWPHHSSGETKTRAGLTPGSVGLITN